MKPLRDGGVLSKRIEICNRCANGEHQECTNTFTILGSRSCCDEAARFTTQIDRFRKQTEGVAPTSGMLGKVNDFNEDLA